MAKLLQPESYQLAIFIFGVAAIMVILYLRTDYLPQLNPKTRFSNYSTSQYIHNARSLLLNWFDKHPNSPAVINSDYGRTIVLPPSMAGEIRNHPQLSHRKVAQEIFHSHLPGFEVFGAGVDDNMMTRVITKHLSHELAKVTPTLAEEAASALEGLINNDKGTYLVQDNYDADQADWHEIKLKDTILQITSRISSRIFLGEELCRNKDWLRVTTDYTITAFNASNTLRLYPKILRPIVNWFLHDCRKSRELIAEAHRIMQPVVTRREQLKREALARDEKYKSKDALDWLECECKDVAYDPVIMQLALSFSAMQPITDLLTQTLFDITEHASIKNDLREEIAEIIGKEGWSKNSLHKMKLLDSTIKETQRIKPVAISLMSRIATERVQLSGGTVIPKGGLLIIPATRLWDANLHPEPATWNPRRFFARHDNSAQLVATSADHITFGHGQHACPGRFFAADEIKTVLILMLARYDFELVEVPRVVEYGFMLVSDPSARIRIRKREEAIL